MLGVKESKQREDSAYDKLRARAWASVPAKEDNPSLGGFPVAHSTPAAEDDDGDANERRKRGLKRSCGGDRLGTEGGGVVEAGEQERGLTSGGGTRG